MCFPWGLGAAPAFGGAGADQVALDIGEASENRQHQAASAGASVGPRFRQLPEFRLRVDDALDDAEEIEGAAGEPINPGDRHHVAGGQLPSIRLSSRRSARAPVTFSR
jgi:hypothetical protein